LIASIRRVLGSRRFVEIGVPALIAYLPLVLTSPGEVGADTKSYLYIDPGRLLSNAPYLWQPDTGLGTVTHQNIGYLWPMGPWFWFFELLGVPDWVAQRLWLGTILFVAAMGVRYLLRTLGWRGAGLVVASLAYMLSPYLLDYSARISVLLLPFAGLPWMIALTDRAIRSKGWKYPAIFGLVVATVGSINATSLLLVGLGPLLWLVHMVWFDRSARLRDAVGGSLRIGAMMLLTNIWWIAGLVMQAGYSLPVTRYTESYEVVSNASSAPEVLRGLGLWFFYGLDRLGPWVTASVDYTNTIWVMVLSFALPLAAWAVAVLVRWRYRAYFLLLIVVGTLVAVAAHPITDPSPLGSAFADFTRTDLGLTMRSTPRAVPLLVLGLAVFLGLGINALADRKPRWATPAGLIVGVLIILNLAPLWMLDMVEPNLKRDEDLPAYWIEAAEFVDARGDGTRVLEVPGSDFAGYRWGNTVDPVTPGLIDRPYVARELVPQGSAASAELLLALDQPMQDGIFEVESLAPIAELMGIGDIIYRADLKYERFLTPRPQRTWAELLAAPGLGEPVQFGADIPPNIAGPEQPLLDEMMLATDPDAPFPPGVAVFPVENPNDIVRTVPAAQPQVLVGNADGLVSAAAEGLIDTDRLVLFAASTASDPTLAEYVLGEDFSLIVTDSNRKQARHWGGVRDVLGVTETADFEPQSYDYRDARLETFPDAADSSQHTVAEYRGGATVTATDYGNPSTYTPSDRAYLAVDGDPATAWKVAAFGDPLGERIVIDLDEPTALAEMNLLQPIIGFNNRHITEVVLHFDDGSSEGVVLDEASLSLPGQIVTFPERVASEVQVEIVATNVAPRPVYTGVSAVGFAEVGVAGVEVSEVIRVPQAFLDEHGSELADVPLDIVLTRARVDAREPVRNDPEPSIRRAIDLPQERGFDLAGDVRLSAHAPEPLIDELVGLVENVDGTAMEAFSSSYLNGDLPSRAASAFDGDPDTAWTTAFFAEGSWIEARLDEPVEVDQVQVSFDNAPVYSRPGSVVVLLDGEEVARQSVSGTIPTGGSGSRVDMVIDVPDQPASIITLRFEQLDVSSTLDWHSLAQIPLPLRIIEVEADGFQFAPGPSTVDTGCRDDLLTIDEDPVSIRVTGEVEAALEREALVPEGCETPIEFGGDVDILATDGRLTGLDLDKIVLSSAGAVAPERVPTPPPPVAVNESDTSVDLLLPPGTDPYWLVLGQSHNDGWEAGATGIGDLGQPTLVQGYANGWLIDPPNAAVMAVSLEWTPQKLVWVALGLSLGGVLLAAFLIWRGRSVRRRRQSRPVVVIDQFTPARQVGWLAASVAAVGAAVFAGLNLNDAALMALVVGASLLVSVRLGRDIPIPALAGLAAFGLTAAYTVVQQYRHSYPTDFLWPVQFDRVHTLAVVAVLFLAAEVVRDQLVGLSGPGGDGWAAADPDTDDPPGGIPRQS
jgi:arabinofuranan 3-O-arabinosyltransferase